MYRVLAVTLEAVAEVEAIRLKVVAEQGDLEARAARVATVERLQSLVRATSACSARSRSGVAEVIVLETAGREVTVRVQAAPAARAVAAATAVPGEQSRCPPAVVSSVPFRFQPALDLAVLQALADLEAIRLMVRADREDLEAREALVARAER